MSSREDLLRSFGMSGYLVSDELVGVEKSHGIALGHLPRSAERRSTEQYPQFENAMRIEAQEMSQHYELFYCLERSIRALVVETLQESVAAGDDWWDVRVPDKVKVEVRGRREREIQNAVSERSERPIDYTDFGELSVVMSANWQYFQPLLGDQRAMQRVMASLNLLRGPIAHCCPIAPDEVDRLKLALKDWFRLLA